MTITSDNGDPMVAAYSLMRRVVLSSPILVVGAGFVLARMTAARHSAAGSG